MRLQLIMLIIAAFSAAHAQNFDQMMTKKQLDCGDIALNSSLLFEKYFYAGLSDSALAILEYWENRCGSREPLLRAKLLYAAVYGDLNDVIMKDMNMSHLTIFSHRVRMINTRNYIEYENYKSYFGFVPPNQEFDKFALKAFQELVSKYQEGTKEHVVFDYFSGNIRTVPELIRTNAFVGSELSAQFEETISNYVQMPEFNMALVAGYWAPTGALKAVGNHAEMGFVMGSKSGKMNYDVVMILKFLNAPEPYMARRGKNLPLEPTRHFFGGYIGFEVGRDVWAKQRHELQLTAGAGLDGFDVFEENKDADLKAVSLWSYNINAGPAYRYYITSSFYLGLRAKVNLVDYRLGKTIDFTGVPFSFQFTIGGLSNVIRQDNLKRLGYPVRQ